jgi:hypothetical protein
MREIHAQKKSFDAETRKSLRKLSFAPVGPRYAKRKLSVKRWSEEFYEAFMNEHDQTTQPPIISGIPNPPAPANPPKPLSWWLRKLFACNPFYLVSAALLLFGCYRISIDATFLKKEAAQLAFNYSSVQFYEILLVFTAIFLARHRIWYDSTLLVGLENLLVFVPFILISQAALIDSAMAQVMCVVGGVIAVMRFGSLKRYFAQLNLPYRVLGLGLFLLSLNVALPLIFRHFGESKIGINIESGAAYEMNEYTWLLILPAAFALANFLPHVREIGSLLPQRRWLPVGLFSLWLAVTSVHVYSLGYVYDFKLRGELLAPALWVLAWTAYRVCSASSALSVSRLKNALAFPPMLIPLLASSPGANKTFLTLIALNICIHTGICFFGRSNRFARHLVFASTLMLLTGLPETWMQSISPELNRARCIVSGAMAYLILWSVLLRNPKLAIVGSIAFGSAVMALFGNHAGAIHWALQSGLAFLLLHSLRWNDAEHQGAGAVRVVAGLVWVAHSLVWMYSGEGKLWMPCIPGAIVLGIYSAVQIFRGKCNQFVVPAAATLVILSGPGTVTADGVRAMPIGLLAVIGSFLLFGCGTIAALTRHRWHRNGYHVPQVQNIRTAEP